MKKNIIITALFSVFILSACAGCSGDRYGSMDPGKEKLKPFPAEHKITGLTHISNSKAYCIPTCLQMVGEWAGISEPVEYYNWLTAYSYGGFWKDRFVTFMPISDAMMGITFGMRQIGLERELYGTGKAALIVRAIKSFVAEGYPVMIMYDYNAVAGDDFFYPHAALITGYTEDDFLYFEPSFSDKRVSPETEYSRAQISTFLNGITSFHKNMGLSEGYHCMIFRKTGGVPDEREVWTRNGSEMKGVKVPVINISTGAKACRALAAEIREKGVPDWGWKNLLPVWFSFGEYSRHDNAQFISERFGGDGTNRKLIETLEESSGSYKEIMTLLEEDPAMTADDFRTKVPPILERIADTEEKAAELIEEMADERY